MSRSFHIARPAAAPDVNDEKSRKGESDDEVCPTRPRTKVFISDIVERVARNDEQPNNKEHHDSVRAIAVCAPGEFYMERKQRSNE